jgi:sporulation protein YlmC with PRC-barrel domain
MTASVPGPRYDAALNLLDRQLVDTDGRLVGKVDDLEIAVDASGAFRVSAILVGPGALGPRFGGRIGDWIVAVWARLHRDERPIPRRLPMAEVVSVESAVHVTRRTTKSAGEVWLDEHVIDRIPGAGHDPG